MRIKEFAWSGFRTVEISVENRGDGIGQNCKLTVKTRRTPPRVMGQARISKIRAGQVVSKTFTMKNKTKSLRGEISCSNELRKNLANNKTDL